MPDSTDALRALVGALARKLREEHGDAGEDQQQVETHISIVLLSGDCAYKFKKPVDLGFADFSTLERRRRLCEEELRLNRRSAPSLYLGLVGVAGSAADPALVPVASAAADGGAHAEAPGGAPAGGVIEYAVKMRRFRREAMADALAEAGALDADGIRQLVDDVAAFHARAAVVPLSRQEGSLPVVRQQVLDARTDIAALDPQVSGALVHAVESAGDVIARRKAEGFVRDCHGDLHLSNIVRIGDRLTPFDCIEFNPALRLVDTVADFAFLLMDLDVRQHTVLANVAFNRYFEQSGDFGGLAVLRLYLAYRSLVRAKVASLQARDAAAGDQRDALQERSRRHVALAGRYLTPQAAPTLWITHGLSGSGKSYQSRRLAARAGWLHVRSDVERKRLLGLEGGARTGSGTGTGAYTEQISDRTYARLQEIAALAVRSGFPVIVDASFLSNARRTAFRELAADLGVPWRILHCEAPADVLRQRVRARAQHGQDPSEADEAVLEHQLATHDALDEEERSFAVDAQQLAADPHWRSVPGRIRPGSDLAPPADAP